jgi:hypothetical protein
MPDVRAVQNKGKLGVLVIFWGLGCDPVDSGVLSNMIRRFIPACRIE